MMKYFNYLHNFFKIWIKICYVFSFRVIMLGCMSIRVCIILYIVYCFIKFYSIAVIIYLNFN